MLRYLTLLLSDVVKYSDDLHNHPFAALNEALKQEVERLKIATGEISNSGENYNHGLQSMSFNQSFFTLQQHQQAGTHRGMPFHSSFSQLQSSMSNHHMLSHAHALSDVMQQDHLGRLQGLEISKGPLAIKSESSSISASESSSTFWLGLRVK